MSTSESRAVTMMIGTGLRARICWQISMPDWSGSMTSSRTRSGWTRWKRRSASWPSPADLDGEALAGQARGQGLSIGLLVVDDQDQGPVVPGGRRGAGRPDVAVAFAMATSGCVVRHASRGSGR